MVRYLLFRLLHMIPLLIGISFHFVRGAASSHRGIILRSSSRIQASHMRRWSGCAPISGSDDPGTCNIFSGWAMPWRLNFGYSLENHVEVTSLLGERIGNTLLLSVTSLVLSWGLAIPLGIIAGVKRNTLLDRVISLGAFAGVSIPGFFLALLLLLFAQRTGWFPIGRRTQHRRGHHVPSRTIRRSVAPSGASRCGADHCGVRWHPAPDARQPARRVTRKLYSGRRGRAAWRNARSSSNMRLVTPSTRWSRFSASASQACCRGRR